MNIENAELGEAPEGVDILALDEALTELAAIDSQAVRVVELRYFAGLTVDEVAEVLQLSPSTVAREWRSARVWLRARLSETTGALRKGSGS